MYWLINEAKQEVGPYRAAEIRDFLERGLVNKRVLARREGETTLLPLESFYEFFPPAESLPLTPQEKAQKKAKKKPTSTKTSSLKKDKKTSPFKISISAFTRKFWWGGILIVLILGAGLWPKTFLRKRPQGMSRADQAIFQNAFAKSKTFVFAQSQDKKFFWILLPQEQIREIVLEGHSIPEKTLGQERIHFTSPGTKVEKRLYRFQKFLFQEGTKLAPGYYRITVKNGSKEYGLETLLGLFSPEEFAAKWEEEKRAREAFFQAEIKEKTITALQLMKTFQEQVLQALKKGLSRHKLTQKIQQNYAQSLGTLVSLLEMEVMSKEKLASPSYVQGHQKILNILRETVPQLMKALEAFDKAQISKKLWQKRFFTLLNQGQKKLQGLLP